MASSSAHEGDFKMICQDSNLFSIFTGDAGVMNLRAVYASGLAPLDLTSCTAINVQLPLAAGGFLPLTIGTGEVTISGNPLLGAFTATISSVHSALLNIAELQSFYCTFTISGQLMTVAFTNALSVFEI